MKSYLKVVVILIFISFCSCAGNIVFSNYSQIDNSLWEKGEEYAFNVDIEDTQQVYEMSILVRNNEDFAYQNLWLSVTHEHNGKIRQDTLNLFLLDEEGKWRGRGLRNTYDNNLIWRSYYRFDEAGSHIFRIQHLMRTDILQGIERIGIEIEIKNDKKNN